MRPRYCSPTVLEEPDAGAEYVGEGRKPELTHNKEGESKDAKGQDASSQRNWLIFFCLNLDLVVTAHNWGA